jgi:CRP/FNR family transcriptional regulator
MKGSGRVSAGIAEFLAGVALFSRVGKSRMAALRGASWFQKFDQGEIVYFGEDPAEAVYVVKTGRIALMLNSPDGRVMVLQQFRPRELFGASCVLTRTPRTATAMARDASEVLVIPGARFLEALRSEPPLAQGVLELLASRVQLGIVREQALAFFNAQARLARHLLELDAQESRRGYITASQEELAYSTGLIRQTVAKALGVWRRDGWLLTGRGRIVILNRKALEGVESGKPI